MEMAYFLWRHEHKTPNFNPIKRIGSWSCLTGSWREDDQYPTDIFFINVEKK